MSDIITTAREIQEILEQSIREKRFCAGTHEKCLSVPVHVELSASGLTLKPKGTLTLNDMGVLPHTSRVWLTGCCGGDTVSFSVNILDHTTSTLSTECPITVFIQSARRLFVPVYEHGFHVEVGFEGQTYAMAAFGAGQIHLRVDRAQASTFEIGRIFEKMDIPALAREAYDYAAVSKLVGIDDASVRVELALVRGQRVPDHIRLSDYVVVHDIPLQCRGKTLMALSTKSGGQVHFEDPILMETNAHVKRYKRIPVDLVYEGSGCKLTSQRLRDLMGSEDVSALLFEGSSIMGQIAFEFNLKTAELSESGDVILPLDTQLYFVKTGPSLTHVFREDETCFASAPHIFNPRYKLEYRVLSISDTELKIKCLNHSAETYVWGQEIRDLHIALAYYPSVQVSGQIQNSEADVLEIRLHPLSSLTAEVIRRFVFDREFGVVHATLDFTRDELSALMFKAKYRGLNPSMEAYIESNTDELEKTWDKLFKIGPSFFKFFHTRSDKRLTTFASLTEFLPHRWMLHHLCGLKEQPGVDSAAIFHAMANFIAQDNAVHAVRVSYIRGNKKPEMVFTQLCVQYSEFAKFIDYDAYVLDEPFLARMLQGMTSCHEPQATLIKPNESYVESEYITNGFDTTLGELSAFQDQWKKLGFSHEKIAYSGGGEGGLTLLGTLCSTGLNLSGLFDAIFIYKTDHHVSSSETLYRTLVPLSLKAWECGKKSILLFVHQGDRDVVEAMGKLGVKPMDVYRVAYLSREALMRIPEYLQREFNITLIQKHLEQQASKKEQKMAA